MQRPNFRHPRPVMSPRSPGFRSPPPAFDRPGRFPSPPWGFSTPPPPFGQRFEPRSPNTPPMEFGGNRNGGGKYGQSPTHTQHRPNANTGPRGAPYRRSPYDSPGAHNGFQGSPRTSTPFGSTRGRERGTNDMDKYYKPSMLQDPWSGLQPISVTQVESKFSPQQTSSRGRQERYYK